MSWRNPSFLLLAGVGTASTLLYLLNFRLPSLLEDLGVIGPQRQSLAVYLVLFLCLFVLYGLAAATIFRKRPGHAFLGLIIGFAILFRVALLLSPPVLSSDLYRYIWDGRVQRAGINPYVHPPSAPELGALRDAAIFPHINRPESPTIYPPGAQMLFVAVATVFPDSVTGMKGIMLLFDLGSLVLILRLLRRTGIDPDRVLLYAWSPLVMFELAGSGHLEAVMLPFVLLALLARVEGKPALAGAALGAATLIKLYPAALFPALITRRDAVFPAAFGATVLLGYLPYLAGAGTGVVGFLPAYLGPWEDFNVGLRYFLDSALAPATASSRGVAMLLVTVLLAAAAIAVARRSRTQDVLWRGYLMVSAFFVFLPTSLHPWYLVWILPFCCITPSWGWLYLSGVISLSYLKYIQDSGVLPLWVRLVEFFPLYILLGVEAIRHRHAAVTPSGAGALMLEKSS